MSTSDAPASSWPDRVRLPFAFDAARLASEVEALGLRPFLEYDVLPLRAPAHLVDRTREPPTGGGNFADGSWTDWLDTPTLKSSPTLLQIVDTFRSHCTVTLVRLLRLAPRGLVETHRDPTLGLEIGDSVVRLTVPIHLGAGVEFRLNGTAVPMAPGECWYLRLTDPHRVDNGSDCERVSLTVDVRPNDWLRSMIRKAADRVTGRSN